MPTRMCAVCRKLFEKSELNRVVMSESGEIFYDRTGKAQARGLYICRECVREAEKKRVFEREYKRRVEPSVYERFVSEVESG